MFFHLIFHAFLILHFNISCYFKSYFSFSSNAYFILVSCYFSSYVHVIFVAAFFLFRGFLNIDSGEVPKLYRENRKSLIINRLLSELLQMVYK